MDPVSSALLSLDHHVNAVYAKLTDKAYEHVGFGKYDLAKIAGAGTTISIVISGLYGASTGSAVGSYALTAFNAGLSLAGAYFHPQIQKRLEQEEASELEQLASTQAAEKQSYSRWRPILLFVAQVAYGIAVQCFGSSPEGEWITSLPAEQVLDIGGISAVAAGNSILSVVSMKYFLNQTMKPPRADKGILKRIGAVLNKRIAIPKLKPGTVMP
ncbi:hypothetical protein HYU19_00035 [Candidatus Woesearchaeota archaeon]|nr:hypothetical protein [Candidatus Woesearchaeota archaeon]